MTLLLFIAAMAVGQPMDRTELQRLARHLNKAWIIESSASGHPATQCKAEQLPAFQSSWVAPEALTESIKLLKSRQFLPLNDASARRMLGLPNSGQPVAQQFLASKLQSLRERRDRILQEYPSAWGMRDMAELEELTRLVQSEPKTLKPYLARSLSGSVIDVRLCGPDLTISSTMLGPGLVYPHPIVFFTDGSPEHFSLGFIEL